MDKLLCTSPKFVVGHATASTFMVLGQALHNLSGTGNEGGTDRLPPLSLNPHPSTSLTFPSGEDFHALFSEGF